MAGKDPKDKNREPEDNLEKLEERRRKLAAMIEAGQIGKRDTFFASGVFGGMAAFLVVADITLLGGLGTATAAVSSGGLGYIFSREVKRMQEDLTSLDAEIADIRKQRAREAVEKTGSKPAAGISKDFTAVGDDLRRGVDNFVAEQEQAKKNKGPDISPPGN